MDELSKSFKRNTQYYLHAAVLGIIGIPIGVAVGIVEVLFGKGLQIATVMRNMYPFYLISLLPLIGLGIVYAYAHFGKGCDSGMGIIFKTALRMKHYIPKRLIPFQIITTWFTHLGGGSAGREGVAVQIGATISYNLGKELKIDDAEQVLIVAGMAAGFAGLFETPIAACCFALEVLKVGHLRYRALVPSFTASITAARFCALFGTAKESFKLNMNMEIDYMEFWKLALLGLVFGIAGALFAYGLHETKGILKAKVPNSYVRIFAGAVVISVLMLVFEHGRYSGTGANLIMAAMEGGTVYYYDWLLKGVLTVLTLAVGFQGGEVTPLFTIGACLGYVIAPYFGMDSATVAALGYAAVFGSGTNTLLAPIFVGGEIFGFNNIPYFVIVCTASFVCNANKSIYSEQRISYTREIS